MVMAEYATRSRALMQVGSYEIVRTIGRGNFAVVKLARHRITNSEVAIKIIDKLRLDQLNLKKIYREIQVLKLLNHQHIIKLYQVIETSSKIYLVCEYARNGELFDYITEQGRLPEEKAKKMFWQVLTAVEYCHKNNVVHRDLKAENLLLDSNNNIKLADFGFSNFYQSGNMLSTWCGSPPYAAPEVFEGKVYEGPHLDVWSLGVVLYVLVCGTFPFDGSNLATLKDRVLGGRFRIPYWMSQDCENLVRRMLVINPKKRLTISQIKKHKWMEAHNPTLNLEQSKYSPLLPRKGKLSKYNEHILKIMQGLGMNRQKVQESLNSSAYDDCFAIYHLLSDRLKLHRTSFPLDSSISYDAGRRRPSNIADQALTSMSHTTPLLGVHQEASGMQTNTMETTLENTIAVPEMQFNDVNAGLPTVQCAPAAPMRYSSPPLPQIKTSVYEESSEMATSYGSPPNPTYLVCQNEENLSIPNNNAVNLQYLSANYRQSNVEMEEPNLGNYNLHQRRHTLMVPSPSQMQMLRAGMSVGNQYSPQLSPHTSSSGLANSREEMRTSDYAGSSSNYFSSQGENPNHCDGNSCNLPTCTCKQSSANYNAGNLLLPCKNLPTSANFSYEKRKLDSGTGPQARRRSGIAHIMTNMNSVQNEGTLPEFDTPEAKAAYIIKQRQQLDSSPIGFREGRRASDGLLLLADNNMLKEHLQKLARTKAVPEMTTEDSQETWKSDSKAHKSHHLRVPTSVNRTNSAERAQIQSSPGTTPVGSGSNISYQPYNNNQSLARRRSLQAQHLQIRITSAATTNQQPEVPEANLQANSQTSHSPNHTVNANHPVSEQPGFLQFPESDSGFQWSSWKSVNGLNPSEGVTEEPSTMWQKLSVVKAGNNWNEGDLSALVVASDEAVPSKAAVAQQQQTLESLTKPIRQQSLPIQPTSTNHPFGSLQPQSMAQQLQQRRLQRRLHIAASHQHQQSTGYQLPLPELEQLKIDNTVAFRHYQNVGNKSNENLRVSPGLNEQDWALHWPNQGTQYATAPRSYEAHGQLYPNETAIPNGVGPQAFSNFEYVKPINYQASSNQVLISNSLPIGTMDRFADGQFSWSYDASTSYRKSFEFSKDFMAVAENLSNSAERLENRSDAMEFAIY